MMREVYLDSSQLMDDGKSMASPPPGEEVVISGMSGNFPDSQGLNEFRNNLMNKTDMITEKKMKRYDNTMKQRFYGKMKQYSKFDGSFFGMNKCECNFTDPVLRQTMELVHESILDAGVHPSALKGRKIMIILSQIVCETEFVTQNSWRKDKYTLTNNCKLFYPGNVAYLLGTKGRACSVDTACSSSLTALDMAYQGIRHGECEAALVGGENLCLFDAIDKQFMRLGILSNDGKVRCFDEEGNGFVRAETGAFIFLQKKKDAKRVYATLIHSKQNTNGYSSQGIMFPSRKMQAKLYRELCLESNVDPESVRYIETHATATKVGDPEEVNAIYEVYASERTQDKPLLVGSVKSNIGHAEAMAGLCSIAKVIFTFETGIIPPNMNFNTPRKGVLPLENGQIKVVNECTPFPGGPVPVTGLGFGGTNAQVILVENEKVKVNNGAANDDTPRLIIASGRTYEAVDTFIRNVSSDTPLDAELIYLVHEIFSYNTEGHRFRGYFLPTMHSPVVVKELLTENIQPVLLHISSDHVRNFSTLFHSLKQLVPFCDAMEICNHYVGQYSFSELERIQQTSSSALQNLAVNVIQICLVNTILVIGIKPSCVIGNSPLKELAEGKITLEDAIKIAYNNFLNELNKKGMLNRDSKLETWENHLCTSKINGTINKDGQNTSDEWTHSDNRKNKFLKSIYENYLVVELSSIKYMTNSINLMTSCENFLEGLGQLYLSGVNMKLENLYPKINLPVSKGTPMISPLIKWKHDCDYWFDIDNLYRDTKDVLSCNKLFVINPKDDSYSFMTGHVVDARNLFPATGYLMLVSNALYPYMAYEDIQNTLIFEDYKILRATILPPEGNLVFRVSVHKVSGKFEITDGNTVVAEGVVKITNIGIDDQDTPIIEPLVEEELLMTKDIYKEFRLRGYQFGETFRGLNKVLLRGSVGHITWNDNLVTFLDSMLQMSVFLSHLRHIFLPINIRKITIDFQKHMSIVAGLGETKDIPVYFWEDTSKITSGGIEIHGLIASPVVRRRQTAVPILEKYQFTPYCSPTCELKFNDMVRICVHLLLENNPLMNIFKIAEVCVTEFVLSRLVAEIFSEVPQTQAHIHVLGDPDDPKFAEMNKSIEVLNQTNLPEKDYNLILATNANNESLTDGLNFLSSNGYILLVQHHSCELELDISNEKIIYSGSDDQRKILLLRKNTEKYLMPKVIHIKGNCSDWLPSLQKDLPEKRDGCKVILVSQNQSLSGLLGLFNCIRREDNGYLARCFIILDPDAPEFDVTNEFYLLQLQKDVAVNIYLNGKWGSYRHLPLEVNDIASFPHVYNEPATVGDLSTFTWYQGPLEPRESESEGLAYIYYASLNFRDVMIATGRVSSAAFTIPGVNQEIVLGLEYSGRDSNGCRIMGISKGRGFASMTKSVPGLTWKIPDQWTMEEAATVPIVYSTVLFAMKIGNMRRGDSVLIHAGTGGIGQAAINYCLFHGCTVFTTVGSEAKKDFIMKNFPQIPVSHIGNSRDTTFEQLVMQQTKGRGVDIVLNSLSDEKLQASLRCLAPGGRFLEIGKYDLVKDTKLDMNVFAPRIRVQGVMIDKIFEYDEPELKKYFDMFVNAIEEGSVKPLLTTTYQKDEIEQAFRYLASGKHMGKVVINIRPEELDKELLPTPILLNAKPQFYCKEDYSYIILGGLGGFGLELAHWLIIRNARKLVLTSRKGVTNGYQKYRLKYWRSCGINVNVVTEDASTRESVVRLLQQSASLGPVGGIFNLAVDLKDATILDQTPETFAASAKPKAVATILLDEETRKRCPCLHQFVVFSSLSCGRGNFGQSNYGMSNSVMERVCEHRSRDGLPGLAIQWGAVGDVGIVAEMMYEKKEMVIGGTIPQKILSCLSLLDSLLLQPHPIVSSMVVADKRNYGSSSDIVQTVANILGIKDLKTVNHNATLIDLGMDSLMAVEIKQAIEGSVDTFLSVNDMKALTFGQLIQLANSEKVSHNNQSEACRNDVFTQLMVNMTEKEELLPHNIHQIIEGSKDLQHLFCITGIDGNANVLENMASKLNLPSTCLQTGVCLKEHVNVQRLTNYFLNHITRDISTSQNFSIIAHSYGGLIALEMVQALEKIGYKGKLFLIESSPLYLKHVAKLLAHDNLINSTMLTFSSFVKMTHGLILEFKEEVNDDMIWEDKLKLVIGYLPNDAELRNKTTIFLNTLYYRFYEMLEYEMKGNIESKVYLFKATNGLSNDLDETYGLSNICINPVEVHTIIGDHFNVLENSELIGIIGKIVHCNDDVNNV